MKIEYYNQGIYIAEFLFEYHSFLC